MKIRYKPLLDNDIWKRDLYLQKIDYVINSNIYEYDISNAGFNLSKQYQLLDDNTIDYLGTLTKDDRTRQIGMIMRDNKKFNKELTKSFSKMRKRLFIDNDIQESHVLSIKKDAVFLINKVCNKTKFGEVSFNLKNRYTSFHRFNKYEFYYRNIGKILSVKGIKDDKLPDHEKYMISFLKTIFHLLETSDNKRVVMKLKEFASMYKRMELPKGFYRELNSVSMYSMTTNSSKTPIQTVEYIDGFNIDHRYNYMVYIIPLIQRYFFLLN